ncbi:MAG: hypothetical protein KGI33_06270 [Thaumarchaeota archaeon]|nr:hypothetical protein [Nitrososphaerota archaeon]
MPYFLSPKRAAAYRIAMAVAGERKDERDQKIDDIKRIDSKLGKMVDFEVGKVLSKND